MQLRTIKSIDDLAGVPVLVRSSLNVPVAEDGTVRDHFRITKALPTLQRLVQAGARTTLISHIGRDPEETLRPVFDALAHELPIRWGGSITDPEFPNRHAAVPPGEILLAENLRQDAREKANDPEFAAHLAQFGDLFINDAFAEVHREHASTYGVTAHVPAYAGLSLAEEVRSLGAAMRPESPALFMIGGAKFETKLPLIKLYLDRYDHVFVGGALANDILKARGVEVGRSLVSEISLAGEEFLSHPGLLVPVDVVVDGPAGRQVRAADAVAPEESILDCGPKTIELLAERIGRARTVLWNGPFGNYEGGYAEGTEAACRLVADATARTYVGGGDTVAAIGALDLFSELGFVSIGGGSMLTFLEKGTTPVLETLRLRTDD